MLLGAFALGLAGAAMWVLAGSDACCPEMAARAEAPCHWIGSAACCDGALALSATAATPSTPASVVATGFASPPVWQPLLRHEGPASLPSRETLRIRTVVLRL